MIIAKYEAEREYDCCFEKVIDDVKKALHEKEDDFLLLCCGTPGTGKSRLMLHGEERYLGESADVKYIGLNKSDFADALNNAKKSPLPRFCSNDEANISKRDSNSTYNKDVIDLYFGIRGLQIFHWWNNPSLDIIDKPFIEERIKGVILITSKETKRPRIYYYFRKQDILRIWEKYGNLKLNLLKRVCKEYAFYRGWFKDYKGKLLQDYNKKKDIRMDEKVTNFHIKYGSSGKIKSRDIIQALNISKTTFKMYEAELLEKGLLNEDNLEYLVTGRKVYNEECLKLFEDIALSKKRKQRKNESSDKTED